MAEHQTRHPDEQKPFNPPGVQKPLDHDAILASEIKEALLRGTESAGLEIHVTVDRGNVRLSGVVDVLSNRTAAEEIVRKIPGVHRIENDIAVANEETYSDTDLIDVVTQKLARSAQGRNIGCRVHKGVVSLVGHADTYDEVHAAVRLVEGMPGVKEVRVERVKVGEGRDGDDADVARAAQRMLDDMGYDHQLFQVYCDAGVLFVKGFVPRREDRSRIKTAMHTIQGVGKLEATLISEDQMADEVH